MTKVEKLLVADIIMTSFFAVAMVVCAILFESVKRENLEIRQHQILIEQQQDKLALTVASIYSYYNIPDTSYYVPLPPDDITTGIIYIHGVNIKP